MFLSGNIKEKGIGKKSQNPHFSAKYSLFFKMNSATCIHRLVWSVYSDTTSEVSAIDKDNLSTYRGFRDRNTDKLSRLLH